MNKETNKTIFAIARDGKLLKFCKGNGMYKIAISQEKFGVCEGKEILIDPKDLLFLKSEIDREIAKKGPL